MDDGRTNLVPMPRCAWDPLAGPRIGPAWTRALEELVDGSWHSWSDVVSRVLIDANVKAVTVSNLLHEGNNHGYLDRRGEYNKDPERNTREIRLVSGNPMCNCAGLGETP